MRFGTLTCDHAHGITATETPRHRDPERTLQRATRRTPARCGGPLATIAVTQGKFELSALRPGDRRQRTVGRLWPADVRRVQLGVSVTQWLVIRTGVLRWFG
jgi:hypothetical protein